MTIIAFDIETHEDEERIHHFQLGVFCKNDTYYHSFLENEFVEMLLSHCTDKHNTIVAHNAQFDFAVIQDTLLRKCDLITFATDPFFVKLKYKNKTILIIDTFSFYKTSLEKLGEMFNINKLQQPDHSDTTALLKYCERDVEICYTVYNSLLTLMREYGVRDADKIVSAPQMSLKVFQSINKCKIIPTRIDNIMRLEEEGYFGGRTEVFQFGEISNVNIYDINSLYPAMMLNPVPTQCIKYYSPVICSKYQQKIKRELEKIRDDERYIICARIKAIIPPKFVAPVPVHYNGQLIFPVGEVETTLYSPELRLIWNNIVEIEECSIYKAEKIFSDFIHTFYSLRQEAKEKRDKVRDEFFKIILNSLYGKFAQKKILSKRIDTYDGLLHNGEADTRDGKIKFIGGQAFQEERTDEPCTHTFIAISGCITSYARAYMYKILAHVPPSQLIYCDTDSIFTTLNSDDMRQIVDIDSKRLGCLKIEHINKTLEMRGNKDYTIYDTTQPLLFITKIKGVPKNAVKTGDNTFVFDRFSKLRESIRRFKSPNPRILTVNKILNRHCYKKRVALADNSTMPLVIK